MDKIYDFRRQCESAHWSLLAKRLVGFGTAGSVYEACNASAAPGAGDILPQCPYVVKVQPILSADDAAALHNEIAINEYAGVNGIAPRVHDYWVCDRVPESLARLYRDYDSPELFRKDRLQSGVPYLFVVMDRAPGQPLLTYARSRKLQLLPAVLCSAVASVVHKMHDLGIIHNDLKPLNVMVAEKPNATEPSTPKFVVNIIDFGSSQRVAPAPGATVSDADRQRDLKELADTLQLFNIKCEHWA